MKKNYVSMFSFMLIAAFLITGCKKEAKEINYDWGNHRDGCRLVFGTNADPTGSADFTFHYNNRGLADVWDIENYGTHTQEYDARGRLKNSTLTQAGEVVATVSFVYDGGDRVSKEIWLAGTDTTDVIYYHYDAHGNLVKTQSFLNDYIATGKYDQDGNLLETDLYFSGIPAYTAIYTYDKHYKNPYLSVPGIDHLFPYYTPMDLFYGKWRWASLKQIAYDEDGTPIVQFEYDASKTIWQAGPHDYTASATYFDELSGGSYPYPFEYDNCDGIHNENRNTQVIAPSVASHAGKINLMMLLRHDPSKSVKDQVTEFRRQMRNIKN